MFGRETIALELIDPRFYHLDTALCPLSGGNVIYAPMAFTAAGRAAIAERVAPAQRIEIADEDACRLAANAVCVDSTIVLSGCSERLRAVLAERGLRDRGDAIAVLLKSGGWRSA